MQGPNITKTVHVISNDPTNPDFALNVTGSVLQIVEPDTALKQIRMAGLAGSTLRTEVTMKKGSWLDVELLSSELKFGNARIESVTPAPEGNAWTFVLMADSVTRPMIYNEELVLNVRTSDDVERTVSFVFRIEHNARVLANPRGQLKFLPQRMAQLRGPNPQPVFMPVSLQVGGPEVSFRVLEVKLDEKLEGVFRTEVIEQSSGKNYLVKVWLDEWQDVRQVIGRMTIVTDDDENPEIALWVMALFTDIGTK